MVVTTAGRPVGIAAMARLIPMSEDLVEVVAVDQSEHNDQAESGRSHDRDQHGQLVKLSRERRLLLLDAAEHPGDLADLRGHAGGGDDQSPGRGSSGS